MSAPLLIAYVVVSVLVLLGLIVMSFKLLRLSQKEKQAENVKLKQQQHYQLHPKLKQQKTKPNSKNKNN